jgi:hypothetical protein
MLRQTCVFASGGICVTRSGFRSVQGAKHRCSIFHALVGRYRFYKMSVGTRYAEHVFLHPVGYAGHVVHFGASGELNGHALFSCSVGTSTDCTKRASGHVMPNLYFVSYGTYRSCSAFRCVPATKCRRTIFHARVGPVQIR